MTLPERLAAAYRQKELERCPKGFTIAPYMNADVIDDAFLAGFEAGRAERGMLHSVITNVRTQLPEDSPLRRYITQTLEELGVESNTPP